MDSETGIEKLNNNFDVEDNNNNQPYLQLTIEIGNGKIENFKLYNLDNPKKDIYEFCMKNNIDYNTMEEITKHINEEIDKKKDEEENLENNNTNKKQLKKLIDEEENLENNNINNKQLKKLKDNKQNLNENQAKNRNRNFFKPKHSIDDLNSNKKEKNNLFPYQISDYDSNSNQNIMHNSFQKNKNVTKNQKINPNLENNIFKNNNLTINNSNTNLTEAENLLNGEIIKIDDYQFGLLSLNNSQGHVSNNSIRKKKTLEDSIEAGKNLYNRGIEYQEKGKDKLEKLKTKLKKEEKKVSTFHPKINPNKIDNKNRIPCTDSTRIINYKQYNQDKINKLKEKKVEDNTNYTFQPKINKENKKEANNIINENNKSNSIFLKLYDDRKIQKENLNNCKNKIENMYSYRPTLNNNNKIKEPFDERLKKYQTKSNEKMKKIKDEIEKKKYIKPKSNLKHSKNDDNNNPYTLMYLYHNIYQQNRKELERKTYSNYFSNPIINKSTDKLLDNKKERSFKKIFKLLDGDEDNLIKNSAVNTNKIPKNIKEILEPIFRELREENETLNEDEFITVCEQIYKSLPYDKKNILLNFAYDKKENKTINYTQKKKMNKSRGLTLFELSNLPKNNNLFNQNYN